MAQPRDLDDDAAERADALRQLGLLKSDQDARWTPLAGGVSSDIWRVEWPGKTVCVKRARPKLAVAAEWLAPVERNASEVAWLELAHEISPGSVPRILGHLPEQHLFVMEYIDSKQSPVWKHELAAGRVDENFAHAVGAVLGEIHQGTANDPEVASRFATDEFFASLRIQPYLAATALVHPDLGDELAGLATRTAGTKLALVHGDVSPKNLLVGAGGAGGPIFLDAECAWYGDPAFDVAFCLTHLLLKCRWLPARKEALLRSFDAFAAAHAAHVSWEPACEVETRVATLLPALVLARVDGKSPVEYLTDERDRDAVRGWARELLKQREEKLDAVRDSWRRSLSP